MRKYQTITGTALYLMVMLMLTIFTSVAVAQSPTQITTIEQLNSVRDGLAGNYVLMNDLDFADGPIAYRPQSTSDATVVGPAADATNAGWTPIGDNTTRFTGTFDGGGFTISNLYINSDSEFNVGLFGVTNTGSEVRNLGLLEVYIKGNNDIGGLVGRNKGGTIQNCYATGTVTGTGGGIGGLVGGNEGGTIQNCYATGTATGSNALGDSWDLVTSAPLPIATPQETSQEQVRM